MKADTAAAGAGLWGPRIQVVARVGAALMVSLVATELWMYKPRDVAGTGNECGVKRSNPSVQ